MYLHTCGSKFFQVEHERRRRRLSRQVWRHNRPMDSSVFSLQTTDSHISNRGGIRMGKTALGSCRCQTWAWRCRLHARQSMHTIICREVSCLRQIYIRLSADWEDATCCPNVSWRDPAASNRCTMCTLLSHSLLGSVRWMYSDNQRRARGRCVCSPSLCWQSTCVDHQHSLRFMLLLRIRTLMYTLVMFCTRDWCSWVGTHLWLFVAHSWNEREIFWNRDASRALSSAHKLHAVIWPIWKR